MTPSIRALYLTTDHSVRASTTVATEGWVQSLRPKGLDPVVVSRESGAFYRWAKSLGIPAYAIPLPFPNKMKPWTFIRSLWKLRGIVNRHRIQIIHCNEQDVYPIGQYLGRLCGLPTVVSVHFTMSRGFCTWAFRGTRQPARMFFVSRSNREACQDGLNGVVPESKQRVLYNGLDLNNYQPDAKLRGDFRQHYNLNSNLLIGIACAMRPRKQLEHLFEVATQLSNLPVTVLVAGGTVPGDEAYAAELLDRAKQMLGKHFVYLGHLNDLREFYNSLDLCINTSQEEGFSISILEALACGCPVVGYPSVSVSEEVLPNGGEIVGQDNIDQLAQTVRRWISAPQKLTVARINARKQAENFDIRKIAEKLWEEYQEILNGDKS